MEMTYEEAFSYCLKKAAVHYEKLKDPLFVPSDGYNGDYYRNYPIECKMRSFASLQECWTTSMVTGLAALTLEHRYDKSVFMWANRFKEEYYNKVFIFNTYETHDLGFLYIPYSVHLWQLSGDADHRDTALKAADILSKRFDIYGRYVEAWNYMNIYQGKTGCIIVSSVVNMSLLFWAWKETGHRFFYDVANSHIKTAIKALVRKDYSVAHTKLFDSSNGEFGVEANIGGVMPNSHWARGTAWMVFGLAIVYSYTQDEEYYDTAVKVGEKYLECIGDSLIPVWNFKLPAEFPAKCYINPMCTYESVWDETRAENSVYNVDTSAAAIMCCAFYLLQSLKPYAAFTQYADDTLLFLAKNYTVPDMQKPAMLSRSNGSDSYTVFGDYFFMYALSMKLYGITAPWGNQTSHRERIAVRYGKKNKIDQVLQFINDNLDKPLTVSELSDEFHFHPTHFIRIFKEKSGMTPGFYVKSRKMDIARHYLEYTDLSIKEIMGKIGENDSASFSKKFKSFYTYSPREYRKKIGKRCNP